MRTVTEMVSRVRLVLQDIHKDNWENDTIKTALKDAAALLSRELLAHPIGQRLLLAWSDPQSFTDNTESYAFPVGCLRVHRVQFRESGTGAWRFLEYRTRQPGKSEPPKYWTQNLEDGEIVIWPAIVSVSAEEYRLRYYKRIKFPTADTGGFNDPAGDGSETYNYPEIMDSAVEYKAALELAGQEYLETAQQKTLQNAYMWYYNSMIQAMPMGWPDRHRLTAYQQKGGDDE